MTDTRVKGGGGGGETLKKDNKERILGKLLGIYYFSWVFFLCVWFVFFFLVILSQANRSKTTQREKPV